jgi:hypothetical protein
MKTATSMPTDGGDNDLATEAQGGTDERHGDARPVDTDFTCPVCGAAQEPSESCRRCRADLSLVLGLRAQLGAKRTECLALLRRRRLLRATRLAQECLKLSDDDANRRLLSTCYLMQGDFATALRILAR